MSMYRFLIGKSMFCLYQKHIVQSYVGHRLTHGCVVVQLCYSILLQREFCTFSNGHYVKNGLAELELWCNLAKEEVLFHSYHQIEKGQISVIYYLAAGVEYSTCCFFVISFFLFLSIFFDVSSHCSMLAHHGMNSNILGRLQVSW